MVNFDLISQNATDVLTACFPLYSVLLAMGRTTIDYLSLNMEGQELNILKTIPFDKVNIKIISLEDMPFDKKAYFVLENFMKMQGYDVFTSMSPESQTLDIKPNIFVHKRHINVPKLRKLPSEGVTPERML